MYILRQKKLVDTRSGYVGVTHIEHRELGQDGIELLFKRVLGELDLAHVKIPYSTDFEVFVDDLEGFVELFKMKKAIDSSGIPLVSFAAFWTGQCPKSLPLWAPAQWP